MRAAKDTICLGKVARPRRAYNEDGWPSPELAPVRQLTDSKQTRQANLGFSYAPEIVTEHPAVVLREYGKGRVAYCAAYPYFDYVDDIHDLIVSLVNWAAGGLLSPSIITNAPGPVEVVTLEQRSARRTVIHLLNWQPSWPGVKAGGISVSVPTGGRVAQRAFAVEANVDLAIATEDQKVTLNCPPVEAWESLVVQWK